MPSMPSSRYDDFVARQYELILERQFGAQAFKNQLDAQRKNQGITGAYTLDQVKEAYGIVHRQVTQELYDWVKELPRAQKALENFQTPRSNNTVLDDRQTLGVNGPRPRQYLDTDWKKKLDSADPKISNIRGQEITDALNNGRDITPALANARAEASAKNRNRLTAAPAPKPGKRARPTPFG